MPNKTTHLGISLVIFVIYYFILDRLSLSSYLSYGVAVFVGAILPDILDPWTKENRYEHRSVWHSTNLLMPLYVTGGVSFILMFFFHNFIYLFFFVLGYLSHLFADSIKRKTWSKGLQTYPTFLKGIKERYKF